MRTTEKKAFLVALLLLGAFASIAAVRAPTSLVDAGSDQTVIIGETVTFNGSVTVWDIREIKWDFGDGSPVVDGTDIAILNTTTHVYTAVGVYTATLSVEVDGVWYDWETDTCTITVLPTPILESCDSTGKVKDEFLYGEALYIKVSGLPPPPEQIGDWFAAVRVVEDVNWTDGMEIPPRVEECPFSPLVGWNSSGIVPPAEISAFFTEPLAPDKYDIIIDLDHDNYYNATIDPLDDCDIKKTAGFLVIPEVPLGAIAASTAMILALVVYFAVPNFRKKPVNINP